jgi:DNA-binding response OmpR family regulator
LFVPILGILLTLLSSVAGKRWALDAGFDDFLILPIEKEELLWRLSSPGRRAVGKSTENDHLDQQAHSHW